jgi:hypothetical protein
VATKLSAITKPGVGSSLQGTPPGPHSKFFGLPLCSIALAAFTVEIPFFFLGNPSGHDFEFHLYTWLDALSQWKTGILYPRWAALAQFGYGEPRFVFYPPASWTLGASLSAIFPWILVPSIYIWLVLVACGTSMFLVARHWFDRRDATFAAVLYAVNPYHVLIVYWRSAFAELLASVLLPLLLLFVLRASERRRRSVFSLAIVLASAWLINAPAAVMIHYSFALLILVVAWRHRSTRIVGTGLAAVALGALLASFYLLPAIYEQKWVDIAQAVSYGVRPVDSFLFTRTTDPDHNVFNYLVSSVATAEILLTVFVGWCAWKRNAKNRLPSDLWYTLAIWAAVCAVLMLPITNILWSFLPKLRFVQFPWRLLLCLGVAFSLFTTIGVRRWSARIALYVAMLGVIGLAGYHFQPPWWDRAADLREMQDNMATGVGYEGTEEYTPVGAFPGAVDKEERRVTVEGPARGAIRVSDWSAERKVFSADMSAPDDLVLHLFNYPAWHTDVNGREVPTGTLVSTGQMLIPVEAGANQVRVIFFQTWDRRLGGWISGIAVPFVIILGVYERRRRTLAEKAY